MPRPADQRLQSLRHDFENAGQAHVFTFWDDLADNERILLLDDLECINARQLPGLRKLVVSPEPHDSASRKIEPATVISRMAVRSGAIELGRSLLADGKVAAFTVAGGQGTRLGFDGPKGAFPISPVRQKTLFQLFAESIRATQARYGSRITWYIMTSPANDATTQDFFRRHDFFGLSPEGIRFFQQGVMPSFDKSGAILLDQKHRIALSPDGHGGSLLAMATTGILKDMARRGIEYISYFQVDNPLVHCLDPVFIGLHADHGSEMSSKTLPKADDLERVGNFVTVDGSLDVIEYSDLPADLAHARNEDGARKFDAANIAIHILSRTFVERLTADRAAFALPWHLAHKKVPHVDPRSGDLIEPASPNATKLEAFIFDALPLARDPLLLETTRAEEFSPVKNPTGVDSVDSARGDMSRRAAAWLESVDVKVTRDNHGIPTVACEISPLVALDAAQLAQRAKDDPSLLKPAIEPNGEIYLGD